MTVRTATGVMAMAILLLDIRGARAMHATTSSRSVARSRDGASVLYEVRIAGPEGGGLLTYRLKGKQPGDRSDYELSSDFSPGDGSRPQTISVAVCQQRLGELDAELRRRGFAGVGTHPEGCQTSSRGALVTVDRE